MSEARIASRATEAIVGAMHATRVRRVVVVGAAPIGTMPSPDRPKRLKHDPALMEDVLRESGLRLDGDTTATFDR